MYKFAFQFRHVTIIRSPSWRPPKQYVFSRLDDARSQATILCLSSNLTSRMVFFCFRELGILAREHAATMVELLKAGYEKKLLMALEGKQMKEKMKVRSFIATKR